MKWDSENTLLLIKSAQSGNKSACEALLKENAPLVKSLVRRFLGRGVEYDDLFQLGNIGLIKAITGFDDKYEVRFSTYAVPMILGEIKRFLRDNNTVKMPRSIKEMQVKIRYSRQKLCQILSREPSVNEIAADINADIEDVLLTLESMNPCASLDEPVFDEAGSTKADLLEDNHISSPLSDKLALRECLDQLDERERKIIILRYFKNCTQTRIAEMMGLSQVQISRIESRTLKKLRGKLG